MRIMVVGATGFIGSAVCARLAGEGHAILGVSRSSAPGLVAIDHARLDVSQALRPEDWLPLLGGIDAVVNCAGTLQDSPGESTEGVHARGIAALFSACERAGVRRVVHLSAIGVDREPVSAFSRSKRQGDEALMARELDWIILRPSVVLGRAAYGGSALIRGLAALPVTPVMPDTGPLQPVQLDDLVETIVMCLKREAPARCALENRRATDDVVRRHGAPSSSLAAPPGSTGDTSTALARHSRLPSWRSGRIARLASAGALDDTVGD